MMNDRTTSRKIFSRLRIIGRQGLAIRGAGNSGTSNFMVISKVRAEDVAELKSWLKKSGHKLLHHDIQNKILQTKALKIMLQKKPGR